MRWTLIAALAAAGCTSSDVGEIRADNKELRSELRELREELREIRAEQRELRKLVGGDTDTGGGDDDGGKTPPEATPDGGAPKLPASDAGPPPSQSNVKISIESNPRGASVWIGDNKIGRTPLLYEQPPSNKELILRIEKPGYRPRLMSLRADEDAKLMVQLARQDKSDKKK